MSTTHTKKDKDTLEVTTVTNETRIIEENRAEIQTRIDHLELDEAKSKLDYKNQIGALKAKIAILDS